MVATITTRRNITPMIWILTPKGRLKMNTATLIFDTRQTNERTNKLRHHTQVGRFGGMIYVTTEVFTSRWFRLRVRRLARSKLREAASGITTPLRNRCCDFVWSTACLTSVDQVINIKIQVISRVTRDSQGVTSFILTARMSAVDQLFRNKGKNVTWRATWDVQSVISVP